MKERVFLDPFFCFVFVVFVISESVANECIQEAPYISLAIFINNVLIWSNFIWALGVDH